MFNSTSKSYLEEYYFYVPKLKKKYNNKLVNV